MMTSQQRPVLSLCATFLAFFGLVATSLAQQPAQDNPPQPQPVPIQIQVQLQLPGNPQPPQPNAPAIGGAIVRGNAFSMKSTTRNGQREIEVRDNDLEVQIKDQQGKQIEMKITRPVDGKQKTDEFKADDLDDLRKKSAEAAKLYEKYGAPNGGANGLQLPGFGGGGIQIQANGRNMIVNQGANGFAMSGNFVPRTIRSNLDGRLVTIDENDKREITVTVVEQKANPVRTTEITAKNFGELREKNSELADLYTKLTGIKQ